MFLTIINYFPQSQRAWKTLFQLGIYDSSDPSTSFRSQKYRGWFFLLLMKKCNFWLYHRNKSASKIKNDYRRNFSNHENFSITFYVQSVKICGYKFFIFCSTVSNIWLCKSCIIKCLTTCIYCKKRVSIIICNNLLVSR